jgi:hypothetical protein
MYKIGRKSKIRKYKQKTHDNNRTDATVAAEQQQLQILC